MVTPSDLHDLQGRLGAEAPLQLQRLRRGALEALRRRYLEQWTQQPPISWSQVGIGMPGMPGIQGQVGSEGRFYARYLG